MSSSSSSSKNNPSNFQKKTEGENNPHIPPQKSQSTLWFWGFWGSLAPPLVGKYIIPGSFAPSIAQGSNETNQKKSIISSQLQNLQLQPFPQKIPQQQGLTHPSKDSPTGQDGWNLKQPPGMYDVWNPINKGKNYLSTGGLRKSLWIGGQIFAQLFIRELCPMFLRVLSSIFVVGFVHNGKKVVTKPLKLTVPKSPKIDGFQVRNRSFPGGYFQVSC